jgi:hypothetical protein
MHPYLGEEGSILVLMGESTLLMGQGMAGGEGLEAALRIMGSGGGSPRTSFFSSFVCGICRTRAHRRQHLRGVVKKISW